MNKKIAIIVIVLIGIYLWMRYRREQFDMFTRSGLDSTLEVAKKDAPTGLPQIDIPLHRGDGLSQGLSLSNPHL